MTKGVQQRRGTTQQHAVFKGEPGEVTVNTDRWTLIVQDGVNNGGYEHVSIAATQRVINKDIVATNLTVSGVSTFQANVKHLDTVKSLFGDGEDLQLYHDGSNSFIDDAGTGSLFIRGDQIVLRNYGVQNLASFNSGGSVELYHNDAKKIETISVGATVFGTQFSNQLNISGISTLPDIRSNDVFISNKLGITTVSTTAKLHIGAGGSSAGSSPLKIDSGDILTVAETGSIEYDGSLLYATPNLSGRGVLPVELFYVLRSDETAFGPAIADYFPSPSSIPLEPNSTYEIEFDIYFIKTTAGTATFSLVFDEAPTFVNAHYFLSLNIPANVATTGAGIVGSAVTSNSLPVTPSLTTAVAHYVTIKAFVVNSTATNCRLRMTQSAGTATPKAGSMWVAKKLTSSNSIGSYIA
jgi:hypothetical protein